MGQDHAASQTMAGDDSVESGRSSNGNIDSVGPDSIADMDEFAPLPTLPEQFHVHDLHSASWLVRRINEARAHAKRAADWADREIRQARRDEEFFFMKYGRDLKLFAEAEISKMKGRRKSVSLPGGVIGFRSIAPKLVLDDMARALDWARRSCPSAIVISETVSKSAINTHLQNTGEIPDGSPVEAEHQKFYVG